MTENVCETCGSGFKGQRKTSRFCSVTCQAQARTIDYTGLKVGGLIVIEEVIGVNNKNKSLWKCRCECGTELIASKDRIAAGILSERTGDITKRRGKLCCDNCQLSLCKGCGKQFKRATKYRLYCSPECSVKHMYEANIKDITGQDFNGTKVLERLHTTKNTGYHYKCVCICGIEYITSGHSLRTGRATRCKLCTNKNKNTKKKHSLCNNDVLEEVKQLYLNGVSSVELGSKYACSAATILAHLKKAGVNIRKGTPIIDRYSPFKKMLCVIKHRAKKSNLDCTITVEDMYDLYTMQNGKCKISGEDMILRRHSGDTGHGREANVASLDRIDSSQGYVKNNLQWVTDRVNRMKVEMTMSEFINMCAKIINHQEILGVNKIV